VLEMARIAWGVLSGSAHPIGLQISRQAMIQINDAPRLHLHRPRRTLAD
jgi:hypothetical protein